MNEYECSNKSSTEKQQTLNTKYPPPKRCCRHYAYGVNIVRLLLEQFYVKTILISNHKTHGK